MSREIVFDIACPRCETCVHIYTDEGLCPCPTCNFQLHIDDGAGLLRRYKDGEFEDLDFKETPLTDLLNDQGLPVPGMKLSFVEPSHEVNQKLLEELEKEAEKLGSKTDDTQMIELSFDPSIYADSLKKEQSGRISVSDAIKHSQHSKPAPKQQRGEQFLIYTIVGIVLLAVVAVIYMMNN